MNTAKKVQTQSQAKPFHSCLLVVDGNAHRQDLCLENLPKADAAQLISEAMVPQIRTVAILIAAMRCNFQQSSPTQFTEEADWFAARIIVLGARRFHLDITLLPMLQAANRRAEAFAKAHNLPFIAAEIRMSLHSGRPANLLVMETATAMQTHGNIVTNSLQLSHNLPSFNL